MKLTDNQIAEIFKSKGLYIKKVDHKGDRDHGMTFTMNRANQAHMFHSFTLAYDHFIKMNWISL